SHESCLVRPDSHISSLSPLVRCDLIAVLTFLYHFFFFNNPSTSLIYTLSLHDALPISALKWASSSRSSSRLRSMPRRCDQLRARSEEHTSELQSRENLVCRLLLEKKKKKETMVPIIHDVRVCRDQKDDKLLYLALNVWH